MLASLWSTCLLRLICSLFKLRHVSPHLSPPCVMPHTPLQATFPAAVVSLAGAPQALWTEIRSPANSPDLHIDVVWENKTATRLPEVLWLRCVCSQEGC